MAATLTAADIDDLTSSTLHDMGPPKFSQIAQELQNYEVMSRWLRRDRAIVEQGRRMEDTLMDKTEGVAEHKGMHEADNIRIGVHLVNTNVPWRHVDTHYGWDRREVLMNKGRALRVRLLAPRRAAAMIDLAQKLEEKAFGSAPNTTDEVSPYNLQYWLVANATAGFNGGYPSGPDGTAHTSVGGVNLTDHPNFKNYTETYSAYDDDNMLEAMRTGHMKTGWKSPLTMKDFWGDMGQNLRYYCAITPFKKFRRLARMQNDNLGMELDPLKEPMFNRHQIVWVPYLDDNEPQTSTIYQVDHASFKMGVLSGDLLNETGPDKVAGYHNDRVVFVDLTYNYRCKDRRRNAVYYYA